MRHSIHRFIAASEFTTLTGLVGVIIVSSRVVRYFPAAVAGLGALAVIVSVTVLMRRAAGSSRPRPGGLALAGLALLWTLGLIASVLYLNSLADEPAAIPLAGVGGLLSSLIGLLVTGVLLWVHRDEDAAA